VFPSYPTLPPALLFCFVLLDFDDLISPRVYFFSAHLEFSSFSCLSLSFSPASQRAQTACCVLAIVSCSWQCFNLQLFLVLENVAIAAVVFPAIFD
jgi:hypothetical protein